MTERSFYAECASLFYNQIFRIKCKIARRHKSRRNAIGAMGGFDPCSGAPTDPHILPSTIPQPPLVISSLHEHGISIHIVYHMNWFWNFAIWTNVDSHKLSQIKWSFSHGHIRKIPSHMIPSSSWCNSRTKIDQVKTVFLQHQQN